MVRHAVPADTDPEVFAVVVSCWRAMDTAARALLTDQLCRDVELIARGGIRSAHPEYTEAEVVRELARRRYGAELVTDAFPAPA